MLPGFPIAIPSRRARRSTDKAPRRRRARVELLEARAMLDSNPIVTVDTNFGNFQIELYPSAAPRTVFNFLRYVDNGAYNDAIFHRSVPGFVEQTGGYLAPTNTYSGNASQFTPIAPNGVVPLEYGLSNTAGTVAMARDSAPDSATSQWFVNLADNTQSLGPSNGGGYAVFGKVVSGMSVLYTIAGLPVVNVDGATFSQLPVANNQLVRITSVTLDSIDGTVFTDVNGNGQLDSGEPGLAGRTVFLDRDGSGVPDSENPCVTTDANGNYRFSGLLPDTYTVREVLPANGSLTTPLQSVIVTAGQTTSGVNLGERVSIEGTVFSDLNENRQLDPDEQGVSGRTVFLDVDGTGVLPDATNLSTTTNSDGVYYFSNLAPGTYTVEEVQSSGVWLWSSPWNTAVVQAGQTALGVNFGEMPPPFTPNENFINHLYHDLLGRAAEPAGMQYWANMIAAGVTRVAIAEEIQASQEYRYHTIDGLYQFYLHRPADSGGLSGFTTFMSNGGTPEQVAIALASSNEYFQSRGGGTDQGYLDALYGDVLHRAPDAASEAAMSSLDFGQSSVRLAIDGALFGSTEYLDDLVSFSGSANAGPGYVPYGWYQTYLRRDAEGSVVSTDAQLLKSGTPQSVVLASILGSDEYPAGSVPKATQHVELQGTLTPTGDIATTGNIIQSGQLSDAAASAPSGAAVPITGNTLLTNVVQSSSGTYHNLFQLGALTFTGTKGGIQQPAEQFIITAKSTVQDLANFMEQALGIQSPPGSDTNNPIPNDSSGLPPGVAITSDGRIQFVSNAGVDNVVSIGLSGLQETTINGTWQAIPLAFNQTQAAVGQSVTASVIVYDSLGTQINVHLTAALQSRSSTQTIYRWYADSPDNDPPTGSSIAVGTGLITFDGQGKFVSATNSTVSIQFSHDPYDKQLDFQLDFSQLSGLAATTPSLSVAGQDGYPSGKSPVWRQL